MMQYDISEFLQPDTGYRVTSVYNQLWENAGFDYRHTPRPESGLLLVTQGSILYRWEDGELQANAGDLLFLPKGCYYETVTTAARDYLVNFHTGAATLPCKPIRLLSGASSDYVDCFQRLVDLRLQGKQQSFLANGYLLLLLERIASVRRAGSSGFLDKVLPLLAEEDLPIRQVAASCGISESGFRALFRKAMGMSPLQYRLETRINKARYLLESTDLPLQQIAEQLHFYDVAYFCKLFKQKTGYSPRKYEKNQKL